MSLSRAGQVLFCVFCYLRTVSPSERLYQRWWLWFNQRCSRSICRSLTQDSFLYRDDDPTAAHKSPRTGNCWSNASNHVKPSSGRHIRGLQPKRRFHTGSRRQQTLSAVGLIRTPRGRDAHLQRSVISIFVWSTYCLRSNYTGTEDIQHGTSRCRPNRYPTFSDVHQS